MNSETIVAAFDTAAHAQDALSALKSAGFSNAEIRHDQAGATTAGITSTSTTGRDAPGFWASLFGTDERDYSRDQTFTRDRGVYDSTIGSGGAVVSVRVEDIERDGDRVMMILEQHHPVDVEERATTQSTSYAATPISGSTATTGADETLQLAEEELSVGKRVVNRGTTRIRRYVVETPVEENVSLRHESVSIERRPVTGTGTVGADAFKDRTIEVTEMDEEAVVAKTAHITEEVVVKRDVGERVETVRDTVRKEQVDVEKVDDGVIRGPATRPVTAR